jgi:hypothetical protein
VCAPVMVAALVNRNDTVKSTRASTSKTKGELDLSPFDFVELPPHVRHRVTGGRGPSGFVRIGPPFGHGRPHPLRTPA